MMMSRILPPYGWGKHCCSNNHARVVRQERERGIDDILCSWRAFSFESSGRIRFVTLMFSECSALVSLINDRTMNTMQGEDTVRVVSLCTNRASNFGSLGTYLMALTDFVPTITGSNFSCLLPSLFFLTFLSGIYHHYFVCPRLCAG